MKIWQPIINCGYNAYPQAFLLDHHATDGFKTEQECQEWIDYCIKNGCFTMDELSSGVLPKEFEISINPTI